MSDAWTLGISTGCCADLALADVLPAMHHAGVEVVELATPPGHFDPVDLDHLNRAKALLTDLHLHPLSIHAPFGGALDLAHPNPDHRYAAVNGLAAVARALRDLGGAIIVVHASDRSRGADSEERLRDALDSLLRVDRACAETGIRMALETPLPHLVGGQPSEFDWLLTRLPSTTGVCFDVGHVNLGRHFDAFLDVTGSRLIHVHVHDNRGEYDDHLPPGEGRIDWRLVFDGLRRVEYDGCLMLELGCHRDLAAHFRNALAALHRLLGRRAHS